MILESLTGFAGTPTEYFLCFPSTGESCCVDTLDSGSGKSIVIFEAVLALYHYELKCMYFEKRRTGRRRDSGSSAVSKTSGAVSCLSQLS